MARNRPSTDDLQCRVSNAVTQTDIATHSDFSSTAEVLDTGTGSYVKVKGKPGFIVDGLIEGTPIGWKLDTGAVNTFITEDSYFNILPGNRPVLERVQKKFATADGSELNLLGTAKMILTFGNLDVYFRVFVGGVKCNLLGQDFMEKFECQWDYSSDSVILNCARTENYEEISGRVVSVETSAIPPRHEAVLKSRVISGADIGDGILVPIKRFVHSHGLVIAHVLVNARNSVIYVRVFNPSDREICVKENTEIALLAPVNYVSESLHGEDVCNVQTGNGSEELPEFLRDMYRQGCRNLSTEQAVEFKKFLLCRKNVFADPKMPAERANIGEHRINLNDETPFKEPMRRVPIFKREILDAEIERLKEQGLIEESNSPWSSPLVLVQKKDKSWRLCVDYRRLNAKTIKDAYPISRIAENLDALAGSKWFTSLDLNMAYYQIPMRESDKEKTAFGTPRGGLYQYRVMPFGLCNAPATFQRVIEQALCGLQWHVTVLYLDDIIVYSRDFEKHLENLSLVFDRLERANLKLKAKKCSFFGKEVTFLGHVVSENGITTDPDKTKAVEEWQTPRNVTELRSFLGLVSYYRRFIKDFAKIAKCLHELTSKNSQWNWTAECDEAFYLLKSKLVTAPILGYPDVEGGTFILDTDASNEAIGAVLSQIQDGKEIVIAYASRTLTSPEKNYCVTRKEMLAVVYFVKHFKHYLLGREFVLRTDHGSLVWLHKFKEPDGQIARWLQQLGPYTFLILHRQGKRHLNADSMSRLPSNEDKCKQCKRDLSVELENSEHRYHHIDDLRKEFNKSETEQGCDVFAIDTLFTDSSDVSDVYSLSDAGPKAKTSKRAANRPPRAKPRVQPEDSLNLENMRKCQLEDREIAPFLCWKEDPECVKPPFDAISSLGFESKFLYSRWELLTVDQGVLCMKWMEKDGERLRICVPRNLRDAVMWQMHDTPTAGHMGVRRTLDKLTKSQYYWPHLRRYVHDYVSSCDICEERKNPARKKRAYMKTHLSGVKFERIAVDIAGPFPKTSNGFMYILVISDYFTKFTEIFPLKNMEAETVTETMFRGWIKRYGCPQEIHSDQGSQFESQIFQEMCKLLQINKTRTTAYHPQSDGMIERMNRTVKDILSKYISVNQTDWDKFVDSVVFAYNSTVHDTTGITPYRMVFGEEIKLPVDIATEKVDIGQSSVPKTQAEYVRELERSLNEMYDIVRDVTGKLSFRQKRYYDRNVRSSNYDIGDLVRRNQPKVMVGTKSKLARKWTGPWIVVERLSDVLYKIQVSKRSKPVIVHSDNLKLYQGPKTKMHPKKSCLDSGHIPSEDQTGAARGPEDGHIPTGDQTGTARRPARLQKDAAVKPRPPIDASQSATEPARTRHGRVIKRPARFRD